MYSRKFTYAIIFIMLCLALVTEARSYHNKKRLHKHEKPKQIYDTRETNAPNFIRLLLMRFVYGLAAQMGE